jgi:tetratricopeptide (TPR) repeat protein
MAAERRQPTALAYWTKALALNGALAQAAFGQGIAYDAMGNDPAAANAFARAARLDGASAADPAYQALALEQAHLPYLAIPPAGAAVSIDGTDPNALAAEGVALIQTGQRAVGVPALEHGVVLTDDPARAQLLISTFLEASVP